MQATPPRSPQPPEHPFLELRSEFPILGRSTYMISNSLGAMPGSARDSLAEYTHMWEHRGVRAWHEGWWEMPVEVGDLVAPLLGVTPGHVAMQPNVTIAAGVILSAIRFTGQRKKIVYTDHNFPSLMYLLESAKTGGAEIVRVPVGEDGIGVELDQLLEEIDEHTALVPVSHVLFRTAYIQDAQRIAERCREVGAFLMLDVYQSAGVLPLELESWGVDAAIGGTLKWLCGGPGNAFLWVHPKRAPELEPKLTGWQSHKDPFGFHLEHDRAETGAWRFLTGTPSIPALFACQPGLRILGSLDPARLRARSLQLTRRLMEQATAEGFEICTPENDAERGGTVTVAHHRAEELSQALLARDVVCDYRPGAGIRLSPHFYNSLAECDDAIAALREERERLEAGRSLTVS